MTGHIDTVHAGKHMQRLGTVRPLEPAGFSWTTATATGTADHWHTAVSCVLEACGIPATAPCRIDRTTTPTPERNPQ